MAKRHLEQYDKNGNLLDIYLNDDEVMVDGQTLADKLSEMEEEIEDAGSGDGTVTGVKVGSTTYEPTEGVVDISQGIPDVSGLATKTEVNTGLAGKVDKNGTDSLMTADEHTKLQNLPTNPVQSISVNGEPQQMGQNGNVNIQVQAGEQVSVIQPDPADGTFTIRVGSTDYTINLNHTHEGMTKLVKCTEATLPQTLADDTIYVQVDNLTTPTEIEALHIFGLEFTGGGLPAGTPQITSPKSTIPFNLGTAYGQGGATGTVQVQGKNLTANSSLTVSVGSGFSLSYGQQSGSSITISAADATIGADVDVFATAYGTSGTLLITSQTDNINHSVELTSVVFENLAAVKLTGTQWLQTDYKPNAATEFVLNCKFSENSMTRAYPNNNLGTIFHCNENSGDGKLFMMYFGSSASNYLTGTFMLSFVNESSIMNGSTYQQIKYSDAPSSNQTNFCADNSVVLYSIQSSNGLFQFSNAATTKSVNTSKKSSAMDNDMKIGYDGTNIMKVFDLTIYELKITENGTVVRDWVPKKKDGVPGLLDIAANGTGTFLSSETAKTSGLASDELVAIPLT